MSEEEQEKVPHRFQMPGPEPEEFELSRIKLYEDEENGGPSQSKMFDDEDKGVSNQLKMSEEGQLEGQEEITNQLRITEEYQEEIKWYCDIKSHCVLIAGISWFLALILVPYCTYHIFTPKKTYAGLLKIKSELHLCN